MEVLLKFVNFRFQMVSQSDYRTFSSLPIKKNFTRLWHKAPILPKFLYRWKLTDLAHRVRPVFRWSVALMFPQNPHMLKRVSHIPCQRGSSKFVRRYDRILCISAKRVCFGSFQMFSLATLWERENRVSNTDADDLASYLWFYKQPPLLELRIKLCNQKVKTLQSCVYSGMFYATAAGR